MKPRLPCLAALSLLIPALFAFDNGCSRNRISFEEMPVTEVEVIQVTVDPVSMTPIVLLRDLEKSAVLPIVIGSSEALAIASTMERVSFPRPMTHDLIRTILEETDTSVVKVIVTELKDDTFYAIILLRSKGRDLVIDSRPSDAIAVALRTSAPIFVSTGLFKSKGVRDGVTEL